MSKCEDILKDLDSSVFSSSEKKVLFEQLRDAAKSPHGLEKLKDIRDKILSDKESEISETKRRNFINHIKIADSVFNAKRHPDFARGLIAEISGVFSDIENSGNSIDAYKKTQRAGWLTRLIKPLKEDPELYAKFNDESNAPDIADAMMDESRAKDPHIKKIAQILNTLSEEQVHAQNNRGALIGILKRFIAHQVHIPEKLMKIGDTFNDRLRARIEALKKHGRDFKAIEKDLQDQAFERWKGIIKPLLDMKRTFRERFEENPKSKEDFNTQKQEIDKMLRFAYDVLIKGAPADEDALMQFGDRDLAEAISQHRFFHFKDGKSWIAYNKEYGSGSFHQAIYDTLIRNANNIAILDRMGTKPDMWFDTVKKRLIDSSDDSKIKERMKKTDKYYLTVLDRDKIPVSHIGAKIGMAIRSMGSLTKLGTVVITAINDLAQQVSVLRMNGVGVYDRWSNTLKQFFSRFSDPMRKEIADATGALADLQLGHMRNIFASPDSPTGFFGKALGMYFKLNLQIPWDIALREGTASMLARNLAYHRDVEFDNLPANLRNLQRRYNLHREHWDLIRSNREAMKASGNKMYVTPDMVHEFTDESIAKFLNKDKVTESEKTRVKNEIEEKLRMYFIDQTDMAQLEPRASERAMLLRGTQPGTVQGEMLRFVSQFKFYPLAVARRSLGSMLLKDSSDGFMRSLFNGNLSYKGIGEYFTASLLFGYMSHAIHQMISYGTLPNPTAFSTYKNSILEGAGLFGDLIGGQYMEHGGLVSSALGPGAATIGDFAKLVYNINPINALGQKKSYHTIALRSLLNFADKDLFPSTVYTKTLKKHAVMSLMNHIDPSAASRMQAQIDKQRRENIPLFN